MLEETEENQSGQDSRFVGLYMNLKPNMKQECYLQKQDIQWEHCMFVSAE